MIMRCGGLEDVYRYLHEATDECDKDYMYVTKSRQFGNIDFGNAHFGNGY